MSRELIVQKTCLLLVSHFRNLLGHETGNFGFHTRLFSHMLWPEKNFVFAGTSESVAEGAPFHPEHVVPCRALILECKRLISEGRHSDAEIAVLLAKHWKVAHISRDEQVRLDRKDQCNLKSAMPPGWRFEDGDTFMRFRIAGIVLT